MLVISAENNFVTSRPKIKSSQDKSLFSAEHKKAYKKHENICNERRKQGRPKDPKNPIKRMKLESQRNLQKISREEESSVAPKNHDELMSTFSRNINQVYMKLKKICGEDMKNRKTSGD